MSLVFKGARLRYLLAVGMVGCLIGSGAKADVIRDLCALSKVYSEMGSKAWASQYEKKADRMFELAAELEIRAYEAYEGETDQDSEDSEDPAFEFCYSLK